MAANVLWGEGRQVVAKGPKGRWKEARGGTLLNTIVVHGKGRLPEGTGLGLDIVAQVVVIVGYANVVVVVG